MHTLTLKSLTDSIENGCNLDNETINYLKKLVRIEEPFNVLSTRLDSSTIDVKTVLEKVVEKINFYVKYYASKRYVYTVVASYTEPTTMVKTKLKDRIYLYGVAFTKGKDIIGYENVDEYGNTLVLGDYFENKTLENFKEYLNEHANNGEFNVYIVETLVSKDNQSESKHMFNKLNLAWKGSNS